MSPALSTRLVSQQVQQLKVKVHELTSKCVEKNIRYKKKASEVDGLKKKIARKDKLVP